MLAKHGVGKRPAISLCPNQLQGSPTTGLKFDRIEQDVTFFEVGGMVLKPKRPTLAKTPQGGAPSSFVTPHTTLSHRRVAFANIGNIRRF
jgi:hypothetical protein